MTPTRRADRSLGPPSRRTLRQLAAPAIAAVAMLAFASSAPAMVPPPGTFTGRTSQVAPDGTVAKVTIKTARRRRLKSLDIDWFAPCDNGFTVPLVQTTHGTGVLTKRGAFRANGTYPSNSGNLKGTQYTASITDHLKGRFVTKRKARGTFQATAKVMDASGRQVSTCTTPLITWTAARR